MPDFTVVDFVKFANDFRSVGGMDFRLFVADKGFQGLEHAQFVRDKIQTIMNDIHRKDDQWTPSESHWYRVAELFKVWTDQYIAGWIHGRNERILNGIIDRLDNISIEVSGRTFAKQVGELLVSNGLMRKDNAGDYVKV